MANVRIGSYKRAVESYRKQAQKKPDWSDLIHNAHKKAVKEAVDDSRCYVPAWAIESCKRLQERILEEIWLQISNTEELYYAGPYSDMFEDMLNQSLEFIDYWINNEFKPHAEEEVKELSKITPYQDTAEQLAHQLFIPFVEQYSEIPKEERKMAVAGTKHAILGTLYDYKISLKALWPK